MTKRNALKVIVCSFLFVTAIGFSQSEIDRLAKKMFVDMNNRDYDAILDMSHPKIFELVTKDQMKDVLKSTLEGNEQFSIEIPKVIPEYKISEIYKEDKDNLQYAFVSYDMSMNMTFNDQKFDEEAKKLMSSSMKAQGIDTEFLSDNTVKITMNDRITVILKGDSTENKWVMMNYDAGSPLVYQLFSSSLLETAKKYKENLLLESKKKREK